MAGRQEPSTGPINGMNLRRFWRKRRAGEEYFPQEWPEPPFVSEAPRPPRNWINVALFFITLATTTLAGSLQEGVNPLQNPDQIYKGIPFSFSLMGILLAHELGHYIISRKHGLHVTLPFFIPAPSFIGTFGAFIKMRSPVRNRKMLLDVGAAGPLVGVAAAIPFLVYGFQHSEVKMVQGQAGVNLGSSLLLWILSRLTIGPLADGYDIIIHPVGFAGWIGLLVTSLNLLPVGQLDGGHVAYALLGRIQDHVSKLVFIALLVLGILGWQGWLFWGVILLIMGFRHPPLMEWGDALDPRRKVIGWVTVAVFILTFTPVPFSGF